MVDTLAFKRKAFLRREGFFCGLFFPRLTGIKFEIIGRGDGKLTVYLLKGPFNFHQVEIYEYIKLDLNDRANLLWDEGVFIEKYIDLHIITNLYYLNKFYVEVVLSNKDGRISEITPFRSGERLEKYIRHVDLKSLI